MANGRKLQLAGIDTDRDVSPVGYKRMLAIGSFQTQLEALARQLEKRQDHQIRVLLMHHSWHERGRVLSIDSGSRKRLDQFLVDQGIQVILTGHIHRKWLCPFVPNAPRATQVYECRSGTTTRIDQVPLVWRDKTAWFSKRNWPENTLIVHRLFDDNGATKWHAEVFYRKAGGRFVTMAPEGKREWVV